MPHDKNKGLKFKKTDEYILHIYVFYQRSNEKNNVHQTQVCFTCVSDPFGPNAHKKYNVVLCGVKDSEKVIQGDSCNK